MIFLLTSYTSPTFQNILAIERNLKILVNFVHLAYIAACDPKNFSTKPKPHLFKISPTNKRASKPLNEPGYHPSTRLPTSDRHWYSQRTRILNSQSSTTQRDHNIKMPKMLEGTTQDKQAMESGSAHWKARPNHDAGIVPTEDKTTAEEWAGVEERKVMVAGERQENTSTATTVSSESKQTGNSSNLHASSDLLEEETDPTSSPSEMLDEPDRKDTESPIDSDRAVYGSNSVHSDSSESSVEHGDLRRNMTTAANLEKMGGQFDESCTGGEAASFHNPVNDVEAKYINDKVIKANSTSCISSVFLHLVADDVCSYHGGHLPSSRGTFPRPRFLVPSLRQTQGVTRTRTRS